jgi:hypothetical protein
MFEKLIRNPKKKRKIIFPCRVAMAKNLFDDCYFGNRWIVVPIIHGSFRKGSFIVIDTLTNEEYDVEFCKGLKSKQKRSIVTWR